MRRLDRLRGNVRAVFVLVGILAICVGAMCPRGSAVFLESFGVESEASERARLLELQSRQVAVASERADDLFREITELLNDNPRSLQVYKSRVAIGLQFGRAQEIAGDEDFLQTVSAQSR